MANERTDGPASLADWLDGSPSRNETKVARKLGVNQSTVSHWKTGRRVPGAKLALALNQLTGVPLQALLEGPKKRRRRPKAEPIVTTTEDTANANADEAADAVAPLVD